MSATGTVRCPVHFFKLFERNCLEKAKAPDYPFILAINHKGWLEKSNGWYKLSPFGKTRAVNVCLEQLKISQRPVYRLVERRLLTVQLGEQIADTFLRATRGARKPSLNIYTNACAAVLFIFCLFLFIYLFTKQHLQYNNYNTLIL